ncbi:hypothetical protein Tco_1307011 [Tanacetum coccineum]
MTCETDIKHNAIVKETASDVLGSSSSCDRRNAQSELNICGSQMLPGQKRVPKIAYWSGWNRPVSWRAARHRACSHLYHLLKEGNKASGDDRYEEVKTLIYTNYVCGGDSIRFTMWNEMARDFDIQTYAALEKPEIIAVGSCYKKSYGGRSASFRDPSNPLLSKPRNLRSSSNTEPSERVQRAFGSDTNFRVPDAERLKVDTR